MFLQAKAALLMRTTETQFPGIPHHIILLWHDYKEGRRVLYHFWGSRSYCCQLQGEVILRTIKAMYQFCSSFFFQTEVNLSFVIKINFNVIPIILNLLDVK